MTLEYHPLADIFELIEGDEFTNLVEDIKEQGLLEPITLLDGKILDGRNRYRACLEAGEDPIFVAYGDKSAYENFPYDVESFGDLDDPASYVMSRNIMRRHLNTSQRALLAAKLKKIFQKEAEKKRNSKLKQSHGSVVEILPQREETPEKPTEPKDKVADKSRDKAGRISGVSGRMVDMAEFVEEAADDEIKKAVAKGEKTVSSAYKITREEKGLVTPKSKPAKPEDKHSKQIEKLKAENEKLKATIEEQREEIADLKELNQTLQDEVQSQLDITADEKQQIVKFAQFRQEIRALESQRNDLMYQVNNYKRTIKALERKLEGVSKNA